MERNMTVEEFGQFIKENKNSIYSRFPLMTNDAMLSKIIRQSLMQGGADIDIALTSLLPYRIVKMIREYKIKVTYRNPKNFRYSTLTFRYNLPIKIKELSSMEVDKSLPIIKKIASHVMDNIDIKGDSIIIHSINCKVFERNNSVLIYIRYS